MLAIAFALTLLPQADVWYPRIVSVLAVMALIAISWLGLWAWSLGESRLFVRLIIAIIAVYFVLGLPFRRAGVANLLVIAVYVGSALSLAMPIAQLVHYACALLVSSVICAMGAYNLEHARRTAWLEARMLAERALQDGLTGIFNRRRFDEHLERVWQQGTRERKPVSLLFADLDHFKKYNDCYGHQAGDEDLKAVAAVLARHARRPLDMAARFGGEEFAVLLYDTTREHAERIAGAILLEVRGLGIVHGDSAGGVLTISIGAVCVQPEQGRSAAGLLQLADQALYAAKDGGRDQVRTADSEYQQMKTGYFHRRMFAGGSQANGQ
ncbi:MAG: GGDEF domain-containing protein [Gammaproteobacteria bacterium]